MDDLKPCPFCGGAAEHYHHPSHGGWSNTDSVCCTNEDCGCGTCLHETKAYAIAAWNTRTDDAEITRLRGEIEAKDKRIAELERERDAAFALSNCECGADEACRNLVAAEARATAAEERLKEATDAIRNLMGIYDTPLSRRRFPPDDFMKEALEIARAFLEKETADEQAS